MQRRTMQFIVLLTALSATLLSCDITSLSASKPTVIIVAPPSGSQFNEGDSVTVQSTSTDSSGIVKVELLVDGNIVRTDTAPSPQVSFPLVQTWKATNGAHTLSVRAYNAANSASDPAAVSISVSTASSNVTPTLISVVATTAPTAVVPATTAPTAAPTALTATPGTCTNNAIFVSDVTIPDNTVLAAGQAFNKIWRLRNTGTCAWGTGYQLVFISGEAMSTATTTSVSATPSNTTADLLVAMTAPSAAGTHNGYWRMKSPQGVLFGDMLNVTIVVSTSGGTPGTPTRTLTPSAACSGTPSIASFTASPITVTAGSAVNLSWGAVTNADSVEIDQGVGGVASPGNITVTPSATTVYTMTAHCGANTRTAQVTVTVNPLVVVPGTPAMVAPVDGTVLRVFPRVATFSWGTVSFPGGVTYGIEIQMNNSVAWTTHITQTGISATSFTMPDFVGDNPGRWRIWATSPSAGDSPKSTWRTFSFNTGSTQYAGSWINDDAATTGVTRIDIIATSAYPPRLSVNPYSKCSPTDCNWGPSEQPINGEPLVFTNFLRPSGSGQQLSIALNNSAGTALKVLHTWSGGSATYTFHK